MASIKLQGSTSGEITISAPAVAGTNTLTLPANTGNIITTGDSGTITEGMIGNGEISQAKLASGVAGTGPAFGAYRTSDQTVTGGVITKIAFETEEYDTNSNYDNSTNYRFTPTVAGYYQINAQVGIYQPSTDAGIFIYKNGSAHKFGDYFTRASGFSADVDVTVSSLVYLNGSTDYVEIYGYGVGTTKFYGANSYVGRTYFNGYLARAA